MISTTKWRNSSKLFFILVPVICFVLTHCKQEDRINKIEQVDPAWATKFADSVQSVVKPALGDSSLSISLWGIDSLVISPIAIDIDDNGDVYYVTTNRQKNSEFDIRAHQDWEIPSIALQTIEDKRAFLHKELSPENSDKNKWLKDVNGDSSHDWRDMTIEKENVYRMKDLNGDGVADQAELVVDDFHDEVTDVAGGILKDGDDLYVAVGPDLWRMKDKNGDGIADDKTSISSGYGIHIGFSGHGMSGVEMGPDGKIYWQIGDIGFNGTDQTGKKWEYPNCGVIVRSNPDGSDFEVFASGLRNTHEFVFDEYGNLISEDNDGDHGGESERLVYVVNGSDAGWRSNWQYGKYRDADNNGYKVWMDEKLSVPRFPGQAAYITPCIANYVNGPTGMVYNPGTALGPEYKNTFFIAEFVGNPARSAVHGFKLKQKGASFELGETKKLVSGILPTGLDFGPDGALYIADWIDGWDTRGYGRIWKLDDKRPEAMAVKKQTKELLGADFKSKNENELGDLLKNEDMRVRLKAQFELVNRKAVSVFEKALTQKENQLARVHAVWGIGQLARKEKKQATLLLPLLQDSDPEIKAQAAKWLGDIKYKEAGDKLIPLLKDPAIRVRFFAAETLGRMMNEAAINPLIELLQANNDEDAYIRHAASLALARINKADPVVALSKHSSTAVRLAAVVALRRMSHPGIAQFLNDTDELVVTEAARAINDDLSIKEALPALGNALLSTSFVNEALIRRCINANLRVGTDAALQNLITYSTKEAAPAKLRAEAIDALSTWAKPSVLDRVDGRYRGVIQRDETALKSKSAATFVQLLQNKEKDVRISAIKAVSRLKIGDGSATLMSLVKNDKERSVRIEALKALAATGDQQVSEAIKLAIADKDKLVRTTGIDLLPEMNISKELMVTLLADVISSKTTEEKQAALLTLGNLPLQNSKATFTNILQQMAGKKLPSDIYLELAEAIDSTGSKELKDQYKQISSTLSPDTLTASYAGSLLGGDARQGRRIFFSNQSAQCIRCHAYNDMGGTAGPRLNGIAERITRSQLLEALINPGARLAPGFGFVTLELKNGKSVSGILDEENATKLVVKIGDQKETISKDQVAKRTDAASSMPDMKTVLTKKQIRDVVSFLSELKDDSYAPKTEGGHGLK